MSLFEDSGIFIEFLIHDLHNQYWYLRILYRSYCRSFGIFKSFGSIRILKLLELSKLLYLLVCQWIYHHDTKRSMMLTSRDGRPFLWHPLFNYEHTCSLSFSLSLKLNISLLSFWFASFFSLSLCIHFLYEVSRFQLITEVSWLQLITEISRLRLLTEIRRDESWDRHTEVLSVHLL